MSRNPLPMMRGVDLGVRVPPIVCYALIAGLRHDPAMHRQQDARPSPPLVIRGSRCNDPLDFLDRIAIGSRGKQRTSFHTDDGGRMSGTTADVAKPTSFVPDSCIVDITGAPSRDPDVISVIEPGLVVMFATPCVPPRPP